MIRTTWRCVPPSPSAGWRQPHRENRRRGLLPTAHSPPDGNGSAQGRGLLCSRGARGSVPSVSEAIWKQVGQLHQECGEKSSVVQRPGAKEIPKGVLRDMGSRKMGR